MELCHYENLHVRSYRVLMNAGLNTRDDVLRLTTDELHAIPGMTERILENIHEALEINY